jgi:hypothetical protein
MDQLAVKQARALDRTHLDPLADPVSASLCHSSLPDLFDQPKPTLVQGEGRGDKAAIVGVAQKSGLAE